MKDLEITHNFDDTFYFEALDDNGELFCGELKRKSLERLIRRFQKAMEAERNAD